MHLEGIVFLLWQYFTRKCWFSLFLTKAWRTNRPTDAKCKGFLLHEAVTAATHSLWAFPLWLHANNGPTSIRTIVFKADSLVMPELTGEFGRIRLEFYAGFLLPLFHCGINLVLIFFIAQNFLIKFVGDNTGNPESSACVGWRISTSVSRLFYIAFYRP